MIIPSHPSRPVNWLLWGFAFCMAASALSRQLAGAALLCLWLAALALALPSLRRYGADRGDAARHFTTLWLAACMASVLLYGAVAVWWGEPWYAQTGGFRMLFTAAAVWALVRHGGLPASLDQRLGHGLALTCLSAFGWALWTDSRSFTTNAIPWAAGIAFVSCVLLPMSLASHVELRVRSMWLAASLAGGVAVLMSESRGAWPVLPWLLAGATFSCWKLHREIGHVRSGRRLHVVVLAAPVLALVASVAVPSLSTSAGHRVSIGVQELRPALAGQAVDANTSIGARLTLWQIGIEAIRESPWIGIGDPEKQRRIQARAAQLHSDVLAELGHLHNDYLEHMARYGTVGLASILSINAALAWLAWRARHSNPVAAWQLGGVLFVHSVCELTNANLYHKYYDVMLAASVAAVLMTLRSNRDAAVS